MTPNKEKTNNTMNEVYINRASAFLPNNVVQNDEIEDFLGFINEEPSRAKRIVLHKNGIKQRYFALDGNGKTTHTNAEMTAEAIKGLFKNYPQDIQQLDLLACGTSSPDQIVPSHAVMVHGHLEGSPNLEVVSPSGACCAGMHALKYAYLGIKSGMHHKVVAAGSERCSRMMTADKFEEEVQAAKQIHENPYIAFEKDFLRWMLSDGAGALLLESSPNSQGLSLRIDWIEGCSFANERETCMYSAAEKMPSGKLVSYKEFSSEEIVNQSVMSFKQDIRLLSANIIKLGFYRLKEIIMERGARVDQLAYFLPHMSSYFFEQQIYDIFNENEIPIPKEKWFTNLATKGNVGAGSIYLMIEELFNSGRLKKGDQILLLVPESARFSYMFAWLTVC